MSGCIQAGLDEVQEQQEVIRDYVAVIAEVAVTLEPGTEDITEREEKFEALIPRCDCAIALLGLDDRPASMAGKHAGEYTAQNGSTPDGPSGSVAYVDRSARETTSSKSAVVTKGMSHAPTKIGPRA